MCWPLALLCCMTLVALGSGCRNCDKVERELRARDVDLLELRGEMDRLECNNRALERELRGMRGEYNPFPGSPEAAGQPMLPIRSLALGRQTGGYDTGTCPGDGALQVVLEPRDCDNHVIKVPGAVKVQALEITSEGTKKPLCEWDVAPDQLRAAWRAGLFGSGFSLVLHWKAYPCSSKLRVIAQFQSADGRVFEADKDVTIKVVPTGQRPLPGPPDRKGGASVEDPFLPNVPSENIPVYPTPNEPKRPNRLPTPEKLTNPPTPVDLGPALPPPMPPPGSDSPASTTGWGLPRGKGWTTSTSGWGAPVAQPAGTPAPVPAPVKLEGPRPVPPPGL